MKYSFDVKDVSAIDLLGNNYIQLLEENQNKGIHQLVGNAVYVCTNTIEMHEIAKKIFNGEAVDMFAKQDNEYISRCGHCRYRDNAAHVRRVVCRYMEQS